MGGTWRDWFRLQCKAIASFEGNDLGQGIRVALCRRWRFHRGPCAATQFDGKDAPP